MICQTTILEEENLCVVKSRVGVQGEGVEVGLKERVERGVGKGAERGTALAKASPTDRGKTLGTNADHLGARNQLLYLYLNAARQYCSLAVLHLTSFF